MTLVPDGAVLTSVPLNDSVPVVRAAAGASEGVTASPTPTTAPRGAVTRRLIAFLQSGGMHSRLPLRPACTADYPMDPTCGPHPRRSARPRAVGGILPRVTVSEPYSGVLAFVVSIVCPAAVHGGECMSLDDRTACSERRRGRGDRRGGRSTR